MIARLQTKPVLVMPSMILFKIQLHLNSFLRLTIPSISQARDFNIIPDTPIKILIPHLSVDLRYVMMEEEVI